MGYHQDSAERRQPDDQESSLAFGMINVRKRRRKQVVENGGGLSKVDAVSLRFSSALFGSQVNFTILVLFDGYDSAA